MFCTDASPRHGPKFKIVKMVLEIDRTVCTKLMLPVHRTDCERATQPYFGVGGGGGGGLRLHIRITSPCDVYPLHPVFI